MQMYQLCHIWQLPAFLFLVSATASNKLSAQTSYSLDSILYWEGAEDRLRTRDVVKDKDEKGQHLLVDEYKYSATRDLDGRDQKVYTYFENGKRASFTRKRSFFPLDTFFIYDRREYNSFLDQTYAEFLREYNFSPEGPTLEVKKKVTVTTISDSHGRVVERNSFEEENSETSLVQREVLIRNGNRVDTIFRYILDQDEVLRLDRTTIYDYDTINSKQTISYYNQDNILTSQRLQTYRENNLPDSSWWYSFNNNGDTINYIMNTNSYSYQPFTRTVFSFKKAHPSGEILFGAHHIFSYLDEEREYPQEEWTYWWDHQLEEFQFRSRRKYYYSLITAPSVVSATSDFKIYPNPANNILYLESRHNSKIQEISVLSVHGLKLKFLTPVNERIDTSDWPSGLYFLLINNKYTAKILVQH